MPSSPNAALTVVCVCVCGVWERCLAAVVDGEGDLLHQRNGPHAHLLPISLVLSLRKVSFHVSIDVCPALPPSLSRNCHPRSRQRPAATATPSHARIHHTNARLPIHPPTHKYALVLTPVGTCTTRSLSRTELRMAVPTRRGLPDPRKTRTPYMLWLQDTGLCTRASTSTHTASRGRQSVL